MRPTRGLSNAARSAGRSNAGGAGAADGEGNTAQLKIAVQAPPVEGRANEALVAFLANVCGIPKRSVELVSGELSRSKVFLLRGLSLRGAEASLRKLT